MMSYGGFPSAPRFITGTDPLTRALHQHTSNIRYKFNDGSKLPATTYAEDNNTGIQATCAQDIMDILEIYTDYSKVSGLNINTSKTVIIVINTDEQLINEIKRKTGIKIVTEMKYLGVTLSNTYSRSKELSFELLEEKISNKINKIQRSYSSLFHKRQLINQALVTSLQTIMTGKY